jgi:predicted  nucleic acid-binding Zn-ribbon protein
VPTAPSADQRRLLELQALDSEVQLAAHQRAHHPALAAIADLEAKEATVEEVVVAARTEVSDIKREVTKAEDDVQSVRDRLDRDAERLQAGQGTPKDLQALQAEIESLTKRKSDLEDQELEAMERLEAAEAALAAAKADVDAVRASLEELAAERDAAFAEIDEKTARLESERGPIAEGIDPGLLALYEKLRASHGGIGAAALTAGQCTGCHVAIDSATLASISTMAGDTILRCEECGRILVREG